MSLRVAKLAKAKGSSPLLAFKGNLYLRTSWPSAPGTVGEESCDLLQRIDGNHWGLVPTVAVGSISLRNTSAAD